MKLWKHSLISALAFLGVCTIVIYSACDRDSCLTLKCANKAPCINGFCQCPTGYEGTQCETWVLSKYVGNYSGDTKCNGNPPIIDTLIVSPEKNPNVISFRRYRDPNRTYTGIVDGNTVTVTDTAANPNTVKITVEGKKITVNFEKTVNGQNDVCTFIGNKP